MAITHLRTQEYVRAEAVDYIQRWLGLPYVWAGDDTIAGFDCSGLMIEVLQAHGLIPRSKDYTAEGLRQKYSDYKVTVPYAGCLVFFIHPVEKIAWHVAICVSKEFIVHASGGGEGVNSLEEAIKRNAYIKKDSLEREIARREEFKIEYADPFRSLEE